jgi:hypothetical protein
MASRGLLIEDPMIVARDGEAVVVVTRSDALATPIDIFAKAQLYNAGNDAFSPVGLLGSFAKFMPYIKDVDPPQPFDRNALRLDQSGPHERI